MPSTSRDLPAAELVPGGNGLVQPLAVSSSRRQHGAQKLGRSGSTCCRQDRKFGAKPERACSALLPWQELLTRLGARRFFFSDHGVAGDTEAELVIVGSADLVKVSSRFSLEQIGNVSQSREANERVVQVSGKATTADFANMGSMMSKKQHSKKSGEISPESGGSSKAMKTASWNGTTLASSDNTQVVEGNQYFPPDSLKKEHLEPSNTTSTCPWKGTAHYYNVTVDGKVNKDAAFYYPQPKDAAKQIKDHVAFWKGVTVK